MRIQQIFGTIIGIASLTIGVLRFILPNLRITIPLLDGVLHITTGIFFLIGVWIYKGEYARSTNLVMGIIYIIFGAIVFNWAHIIAGVVSCAVSAAPKK